MGIGNRVLRYLPVNSCTRLQASLGFVFFTLPKLAHQTRQLQRWCLDSDNDMGMQIFCMQKKQSVYKQRHFSSLGNTTAVFLLKPSPSYIVLLRV